MTKEKRKLWLILGLPIFVIYIFVAARPAKKETVLEPRWINSFESNYPLNLEENAEPGSAELIPFLIGRRAGYIADNGKFASSKIFDNYVAISGNNWAEYEAKPSSIQVMNPGGENVMLIENPKGYPLFLDNRTYIIGNEQNSITAIGNGGEALWTYDFPAPVTCIDASGGFVLAGTIDGTVELLDSSGKPVFTPFEPGGSRLPVILGCAISRDTNRLAIISGIDNQRFLLMERSADNYKVVHHEFLGTGFRRPVHVNFVDNDRRVAYEREGGLNIYAIGTRSGISLSLEGKIEVMDNSGGERFLFLITTQGVKQKRLVAVQYPGTVVIEAPFASNSAFLARRGERLYVGGDLTLASFVLEEK